MIEKVTTYSFAEPKGLHGHARLAMVEVTNVEDKENRAATGIFPRSK